MDAQLLKDAPEEIRGIGELAKHMKRHRNTITRHLHEIPHGKVFGEYVFIKANVIAALRAKSPGGI